jgi:hypothetical protein
MLDLSAVMKDWVATALGAGLLRRRSPKEGRPHPRLEKLDGERVYRIVSTQSRKSTTGRKTT